MLRRLMGWFPPERRCRRRVCDRIERLEDRWLLSTAATGSADLPPVLVPLATRSVEEGSTLTVQVQATDPNPGHTVTYSLDPGAPAGATIDPVSGLLVWTPPNVQAIQALPVRATDSGPEALSSVETLSVMVFDVPPTIQAGVNTTINLGTEFVRSGTFTDPNPDSWTATVDYGDGSGVRPLVLGSGKTFELDHAYQAPGSYVVSLTVFDSQGGQGHSYFAVQVAPTTGGTATQATTPTASPPGAALQLQGSSQSEAGGSSTSGSNTKAVLLPPLTASRGRHPRIHHNPRHGHH